MQIPVGKSHGSDGKTFGTGPDSIEISPLDLTEKRTRLVGQDLQVGGKQKNNYFCPLAPLSHEARPFALAPRQ